MKQFMLVMALGSTPERIVQAFQRPRGTSICRGGPVCLSQRATAIRPRPFDRGRYADDNRPQFAFQKCRVETADHDVSQPLVCLPGGRGG